MFALFIVVIMAASTVGFAVLYRTPDQQDSGGSDDTGTPDQPATAIDFQANNIDATVLQLLPSVRVGAETTQTDISALNSAIYQIKGVKKVTGSFQQWQQTTLGRGYVYIADISYSRDYNAAYIIEKLGAEVGLQSISGMVYCEVRLPKRILFESANTDLNLSREYDLNGNSAEGLVSLQTIPGDELKADITATFLGAKPANISAVERENISATPVQGSVSLSAPVESLEKTLLLSASVKFSQQEKIPDLNNGIKAIDGIVDANISAQDAQPLLFIESEQVIDEAKSRDLNEFLMDLNAESVYAPNGPLSASLLFAQSTTAGQLLEKKQMIENKLGALDINATVSEGTGSITGQAELASEDSTKQGEELEKLFAGAGMELEDHQPGKISVSGIFDPETGKTNAIDSNSVQAFLLPGHAPQQSASVEITYQLVRGKIAGIYAVEK